MKKALWYVVGMVFLLSTLAFAADKSVSTDKVSPVNTNIVKAAKMHATGKVIEISDTSIKIERTIKGDVQTMEFALEKPVKNIIVNDFVKIAYMEKDGKLIASRVTKVTFKKKEIKPAEVKPDLDKK
jgi:poly(3-hydroxyalkanoate) synthetase